jgi:hypothetical protein
MPQTLVIFMLHESRSLISTDIAICIAHAGPQKSPYELHMLETVRRQKYMLLRKHVQARELATKVWSKVRRPPQYVGHRMANSAQSSPKNDPEHIL